MQTSAPTYRKMPNTASRKIGSLSRPTLEPMLGGTSALVSSTLQHGHQQKGQGHQDEEHGKARRANPCRWKTAMAATTVTR